MFLVVNSLKDDDASTRDVITLYGDAFPFSIDEEKQLCSLCGIASPSSRSTIDIERAISPLATYDNIITKTQPDPLWGSRNINEFQSNCGDPTLTKLLRSNDRSLYFSIMRGYLILYSHNMC